MSHIGERAVVIVVIELERGRRPLMAGKIFAVDQQDVGIAIVIVINESASWAHGFRQPFLSEGSIVVEEV